MISREKEKFFSFVNDSFYAGDVSEGLSQREKGDEQV